MVQVRTLDGDMVDLICHRHYGRTHGVTESVLEANPGLADQGEVLPAGLVIDLPDSPEQPAEKQVMLWA